MEPLNKKTRNILIVIYAITFLILAIIYIATRNNTANNSNLQISPTETPTFTPSPTWTPTPTYPPPAPQEEYKNEKYGYQITYGKGTKVVEHNTDTYGLTSFDNGCYQIYSIPVQSIDKLSSEKTGIPFDKLSDLKTLPNEKSVYVPEMSVTFTKTGDVSSSGYTWYDFSFDSKKSTNLKNYFEFTYKDDYLYTQFYYRSANCTQNSSYYFDFLNISINGWKTYTHPKGLYTIQYPSNQNITEGKKPSADGEWYSVPDAFVLLPIGLSIEYTPNTESVSLFDYLEKHSNCIYQNAETRLPYILNGYNAYRYELSPCGIWGYTEIDVLHNKNVYKIQIINDSNVAKKILETFKFID